MKELNCGAGAPSNACVYTTNDIANCHRLAPLLIDRLGMPHGGKKNRLILAAPLSDPDDLPLSAQMPPTGLPLFDWLARPFSTQNEAGHPARDEGGNNAVHH